MPGFGSFFSRENLIDNLRIFNRAVALTALMAMVVETGEDIHYSEELLKIVTLFYSDYALSGKSVIVPELFMNTFAAGNVFGQWLRVASASNVLDFALYISNIAGTCLKPEIESAAIEKSITSSM